jgi:hypothetical protein
MVGKQERSCEGQLGIRKVWVEYPQGWLFTLSEKKNAQAAWRTDPSKSRKSSVMGDIERSCCN